MLAPLPPPMGGMARWTLSVLDSPLAEEFELRVVDMSPPDTDDVSTGSRFHMDRATHSLVVAWRALYELVIKRPGLVHIHSSYHWGIVRDGLVIWTAWLLRIPVLIHFHGGTFESFAESLPGPLRFALKVTLRRLAGLIAITRDTERYLTERYGAEHVRYLPNFVKNRAGVRAGDATGDPVRVLFVGWLVEAKGLPELMQAAAQLPEAHFELVGPYSDAYIETLRKAAKDAGDHVEIVGPESHDQVLERYGHADIFVLPTHNEGFPMVLVEAMDAGLPVVTTDVGAIADIVRDGEDGFVVAAHDAAALTDRLRELIDDQDLRVAMGAKAAARVEEHFTLDVVADQIRRIYREYS
jgi:glycosyltransferase involved in cell wall biosynthesis